MNKYSKLRKYTELFRRQISRFLAPNVQIKTRIFPVNGEGAVFEFILDKDGPASEVIEDARESIGKVLSQIPQRFIGGNIDGVRFGGTNIMLEGNRVLLIKGEDSPEHWTTPAIHSDVERVVSTSLGSKNQ